MIRAAANAMAWPAWIPLAVLPTIALATQPILPAWAFMWLLAAAIFLGCKWQTWWDAGPSQVSTGLSMAYLLAWPGMDARAFLKSQDAVKRPGIRDWLWASGKTLLGILLFWVAARVAAQWSELLAGWVGMIGLIFLLHFGAFHLLALMWQQTGVDAQPIMHAPHRAASLAEFWGKRWNLGFRQLTHDLIFTPLARRAGVPVAILAAFFASGLIHDVVISLPAGSGFGLPTAYFLLQGLGVAVERSSAGKRLGLGRGIPGRLFALAMVSLPVVWLFHPRFVNNVMLPFLRVTGAL